MAKKKNSQNKTGQNKDVTGKSSLEEWLGIMRDQYPSAVQHFESFLQKWDQATIGAAFAQLGTSSEAIALYLNANNAPAIVNGMDTIKSSLEIAFRNSQQLSDELAW